MYSILQSLKCLQRWLVRYPEEIPKQISPTPTLLPLQELPKFELKPTPVCLSESEWYAWNVLTATLPVQVVWQVFMYIEPRLVEHMPAVRPRPKPVAAYTIPSLFVERVSSSPNQPSLVFTIGPPGIGKTVWAKANFDDRHIITLTDFFDVYCGGVYDHTRMPEAYEWCFDQTVELLDSGMNAVLNNTNTDMRYMYRYITYILFRGLPHKVVFALFPCTQWDFKKLRNRAVYRVPWRRMQTMIRNVERISKPCIKDVLDKGPYRRWREWTDCVYIGIFLTPESQEKLDRWVASKIKLLPIRPEHPHITLVYRPSKSEVDRFVPSLRKPIAVRILGIAKSKLVQAVSAEILDKDLSQLCANKFPHITIATQPWIKPMMSNDLLEFGKKPTPPNEELVLTGHCDALMRNQRWLTELFPAVPSHPPQPPLADNAMTTSDLTPSSSCPGKIQQEGYFSFNHSAIDHSLKRRAGGGPEPSPKRRRTQKTLSFF